MGGLVLFASAAGGFGRALVAFLIAAATMFLLMLGITVLAYGARQATIQYLKQITPLFKRIAGVILILAGTFLFLSSIFVDFFRRLFFPG